MAALRPGSAARRCAAERPLHLRPAPQPGAEPGNLNNIPVFAVFLLQGALDFANDGRALKGVLGADHHQLVIMPDDGFPLISKPLRLPGRRPADSYPASPMDFPTAWPAPHKAHRNRPDHVGGRASECLGIPAPGKHSRAWGAGREGPRETPAFGRRRYVLSFRRRAMN